MYCNLHQTHDHFFSSLNSYYLSPSPASPILSTLSLYETISLPVHNADTTTTADSTITNNIIDITADRPAAACTDNASVPTRLD
jgi:hypothetical protein